MQTTLPSRLVRAVMIASAIVLGGLLLMEPGILPRDAGADRRSTGAEWAVSATELYVESDSVAPVDGGGAEAPRASAGPVEVAAPDPQRFGKVTIRVLARDGHAPVKDAVVWTVPSHSELLVTGADGSVTFYAESDEILAGVDSAPGYLPWDPRKDPDGSVGEAGSMLRAMIEVPAGSASEVELFVRLGAVIRGSLVDASGSPMAGASFGFARAANGEWAPGSIHTTDEGGRFEMIGLAPGWYLVAPDPHSKKLFQYERVEADWGSVHELVAEELPAHVGGIEVVPEGIGEEDPWPFVFHAWLIREDLMKVGGGRRLPAERYRERFVPLGDGAKGAVTFDSELREGPYFLRLTARSGPGASEQWLGAPWTRTYRFTVNGSGEAIFPESGATDRLVIKDMDNVAELDISFSGAASELRVRRENERQNQLFIVRVPKADENGARSLRGRVDLGQVPQGILHLYEHVYGEPSRLMETVELAQGRREMALHFLGAQER